MGHIDIDVTRQNHGGEIVSGDVPLKHICSMGIIEAAALPEAMKAKYKALEAQGVQVICAVLSFSRVHKGMSGEVPVLLTGPSVGIARQQLTPMN